MFANPRTAHERYARLSREQLIAQLIDEQKADQANGRRQPPEYGTEHHEHNLHHQGCVVLWELLDHFIDEAKGKPLSDDQRSMLNVAKFVIVKGKKRRRRPGQAAADYAHAKSNRATRERRVDRELNKLLGR